MSALQMVSHSLPGLPQEFIASGRLSQPFNDIRTSPLVRHDPTNSQYLSTATVVAITPYQDLIANNFKQTTAVKRQEIKTKLEQLQNHCVRHKLNINVNVNTAHTWVGPDSVQSLLRQVVDDHAARKKDKKVMTALEKSCRKVLDYGDGVRRWLDLLPGGEYTSILCGTFKLIISVRMLIRT